MKILLVEDEPHIAQNIKKGLEIKSYVVDVVYEGQKGLDFALAEDYDVIILDWMLPGMSGQKIAKELRKAGNSTPILMLTAKTTINSRVQGLDSGADDYLGKPFAFKELLARIRALSRRGQKPVQTDLLVGDLTLDPTNYQVKRAGQEIHLSKQEFALLEFLMRHPGQVFSKEDLLEKVWSFDSDILPNTVQVYIGYLRNKIDKPFPKLPALIQTVRGFGYKIEAQFLEDNKNNKNKK
jgi:DNA-binding response OmpR family regulator